MLKEQFINLVGEVGNTKASIQTADEAIRAAETALTNHRMGIMHYLDGSSTESFTKLCINTFDSLVKRVADLDPDEDSEFAYIIKNMPLCKKYLSKNLMTALVVYSAIMLDNIVSETLHGASDEAGSIEVLDSISEGDSRKIITLDITCFTFSGLVGYLSTSTSRSLDRLEDDQVYKGILENILNRTKSFRGISVDKFIKVVGSIDALPFSQQGIRGDLPDISAFLAMDTIRRFGEGLISDRSRYTYTLSTSAYNSYKLLLDDYISAMIEDAKRLVAFVEHKINEA